MYTPLTLFGLGLLGVILHNLIKLNTLKKSSSTGDVNYGQYLKMEWITILISVLVVVGLVWTSQEVEELANAGKWLGIGFIAAGYLAQSLLVAFMGRAEGIIKQKTDSK